MKIKRIELINFRNYEKETFDFGDNINVLYGKNGQGKTNVIEALYFFSNGRSYRTNKDKETIKKGCEKASLKIEFESNKRDTKAEIELDDGKIIKINGISIKKLSELMGYLKVVMFTPDLLELIKEGPSKRRSFIDNFISLLYPVYFKNLVSYYKVLKQKNTSLKEKNISDEMLDIWNESLAKYGSNICKYREYITEKINPYANKYQKQMSKSDENFEIKYIPSVKENYSDKDYFYSVLSKNKKREKEFMYSLIGPHRDDFEFNLNNLDMRSFASQGQIRTAVLSLILSQSEIINDMFLEYPVILLDDIMSELDIERRKYLMSEIKDKQVIISCTEKESFNEENIKFFQIEEGKII